MAFEFITEQENPQGEATPTMAEVIKQARKAGAVDMRVALPAEVVKYDHQKQRVDVKPLLKKKYNDGSVVEMPVIYSVPVAHPRAGKAFVHMPIKKGHNVLLVFVDRSIDKWLSTGGNVDPEDVRAHHISDAVAYPGLYPFSDPAAVPNGDDIVISNETTHVHVKKNNHYQVKNSNEELVKVLCDFVRAVREARTYTGVGMQLLNHQKFPEIEQRLKTFLES